MSDPTVKWRLGVTDNVSRALRSIEGRVGSLGAAFGKLGRFTSIAAVGTAITGLAKAAIDMADRWQDASERLNIGAETLQRISLAAKTSGADFEIAERGIVKLARVTEEALGGNKKAADAFRQLGIDAKAFGALPLEERLAVVGEQLRKLPEPGQRIAALFELMGKGSEKLIPLLTNYNAKLAETNNVLSNEQVKALAEAKDAWEGLWNAIVVGSGQALVATGNFFTQSLQWLRENSTMAALDAAHEAARDPLRRGHGAPPRPRAAPLTKEQQAAIIGMPTPPQIQLASDTIAKEIAAARKKFDEAARADVTRISETVRTPLEVYSAGLERVAILQDRYGLSAEAAGRYVAQLGRELGAAVQAEVDATQAGQAWNDALEDAAKFADDALAPFDRLAKAYARIDELVRTGQLTPEIATAAKQAELDKFVDKATKAADVTSGLTASLLEDIKSATEGFAREITDVFFDTTQSIGDMFRNLATVIAKSLVQRTIVQPLLDSVFGLLQGLGGITEIDLSTLPKRRASGGPVSANSPFLVGEAGPELFVPRTAGQIVPNGQLAAAGVPVNISITALDTQSGVAWLAANENVIVNLMRRAQLRAGRRPSV